MNAQTAMLDEVSKMLAARTEKPPMKNPDSRIFRDSLMEAVGVFRPPEETANAMKQFDALSKYGQGMAAEVVLNSLGLQESKAGVCDYIQGQLEKLSTAKSPEHDAVKRVKQILSRLKANVQKGAITVNGDDLTEWARKEAEITIPPELRDEQWTYTATASHKVNGKEFKEFGLRTVGGGRKS